MGGAYNLINGVVICTILATWTAYFALPEPKRRMIVLPTTSPICAGTRYRRPGRQSPALSRSAVWPPELFAPAELEVMRRASLKMVIRSLGQRAHTRRARASA